jgi:Flp pilus assembly protein TadD
MTANVAWRLPVGGWSQVMALFGGKAGCFAPQFKFVTTLMVCGLALSACQTRTASLDADPVSTATTSSASTPSFKRTEILGKQWEANPADVKAALAYAESLGAMGQGETQAGVLKTVADRNASNAEIQNTMGKKLLAMGQGQMALDLLQRSATLNPQNWQARSAYGAALDQSTRHAEAREQYQAALALKPGELAVINNLAMSYALQGKLPEAEKTLREAMAMPGSKALPRIRQNLALVVGLQGRLDESQQIASEDLPADQVQANRVYLQEMLSKPNTWAQLQED